MISWFPTLTVLLTTGCGGEDTGSPAPVDSAAPAAEPWFDEAVLEPAFSHANAIWAGVGLLDYDGDGWLDIFFTNGLSHPDALYRNNGDGTFTDVAQEAGVDSRLTSGSVAVGDIDNDGDPDMLVASECLTGSWNNYSSGLADGGKRLYRNSGDGTFAEEEIVLSDSLQQDLLANCTISMTLLDVDSDGWLDLVVLNGADPDIAPPWIFDKHAEEAHNFILMGDGEGGFDRAVSLTGSQVSFTAAAVDVDGDGTSELIIGEGGADVDIFTWEDGQPVRQPSWSVTGQGLWMGMALGDYDGDGDVDIYSTNMGTSPLLLGYTVADESYPGDVYADTDVDITAAEVSVTLRADGIYPFHAMLRTEGGQLSVADWPLSAAQLLPGDLFTAAAAGEFSVWANPTELGRYGWGWGAAAADFDADGWTDVAFTGNNCSAPMEIIWSEEQGAGPGGLLINDSGAGFIDRTWEAGVANVDTDGHYPDGRGLAVGDLNNDGYADLVFANRTYNISENSANGQSLGIPRVWLSRPRAHHWLQIDLVGTASNRDGYGALVSIDDGQRTQTIPFSPGGSTNSANEGLLSIGLGDAETVDVAVRFPSGEVVTRSGVAADQRIVIEEGQ